MPGVDKASYCEIIGMPGYGISPFKKETFGY
jgi:hypothetical protein